MREGPGRQDPEREDRPKSKAKKQGRETGIFLWDGSPRGGSLVHIAQLYPWVCAEQRRVGGIGYFSKCVGSSIGKDVATLPPPPFLTYSIPSESKSEKDQKRKHTQTSRQEEDHH